MSAVTIIIPAFRNAATLSRTLASVYAQYHTNWRIIVACDGATDGTYEIACQAAAADSRVVALDLPHGGPSKARNAALAKADGEWLLFLDADDTIAPTFLSHMLRVAARYPEADIIACGYRRLDELGRVCDRFAPLPLDKDGLAVCAAGPPGAIHSFIVRRKRVVKCGGFDETLQTNEDWDLWLRLAQDGCRFAVTRRVLADYWSSADSLTRDTHMMVRDARTMLERARAVQANPALGLEHFDMRSFPVADLALRNWMWSAGVAIGQGRDVPNAFNDLGPEVDCRYQKDELALRLFNGMVIGSGTGLSGLVQRWQGLHERVEQVLGQLARHVGHDDVVVPIARDLQLQTARHGRLKGQIDLGLVLGVPLSPAMLWRGFQPQTLADMIVFQVPYLRPITWFSFEGPLLGGLAGVDVRRIIWHSIKRRLLAKLARTPLIPPRISKPLARYMALARRVVKRIFPAYDAARPAGTLGASVRKIEADLQARDVPPPPVSPALSAAAHPDSRSSPEEWDAFFEQANPWRYDSAYEQVKYQRTSSLIRPNAAGKALEIACAEGHFTIDLASHFGSVTALDISERAIERAKQRVAGRGSVNFVQTDVFRDGIAGRYDLITCSEMLYFAPSVAALEKLADNIAAALNQNGQFVHAHAFLIGERPDRTAFDWDGTAGGDKIFEIFNAAPGLRHVRAIITDLYRIDLFEKAEEPVAGAIAPAAVIETMPLGCELTDPVAGDVVWDGAILSRSDAKLLRTTHIPVLLFHGLNAGGLTAADEVFRLSAEVFDAHLRLLRRHGFRSLGMDEWERAARYSGNLHGRPLMLTFDTLDHAFIDQCWPIMRRNGFQPHVFATPDELLHVAGTEATIKEWVSLGLSIGSRLDGRAADTLLSPELLQVSIETRLKLEALTGLTVRSVALPMGMIDHRIAEILRAAGFYRCFLDDGGIATLSGREAATPRIDMAAENVQQAMLTIIAPS